MYDDRNSNDPIWESLFNRNHYQRRLRTLWLYAPAIISTKPLKYLMRLANTIASKIDIEHSISKHLLRTKWKILKSKDIKLRIDSQSHRRRKIYMHSYLYGSYALFSWICIFTIYMRGWILMVKMKQGIILRAKKTFFFNIVSFLDTLSSATFQFLDNRTCCQNQKST